MRCEQFQGTTREKVEAFDDRGRFSTPLVLPAILRTSKVLRSVPPKRDASAALGSVVLSKEALPMLDQMDHLERMNGSENFRLLRQIGVSSSLRGAIEMC